MAGQDCAGRLESLEGFVAVKNNEQLLPEIQILETKKQELEKGTVIVFRFPF
jgi:hypothetical protein